MIKTVKLVLINLWEILFTPFSGLYNYLPWLLCRKEALCKYTCIYISYRCIQGHQLMVPCAPKLVFFFSKSYPWTFIILHDWQKNQNQASNTVLSFVGNPVHKSCTLYINTLITGLPTKNETSGTIVQWIPDVWIHSKSFL